MDENLQDVLCRQMLNLIRMDGGHTRFRTLTIAELRALERLEQEGRIERDATGNPHFFNFKLKSAD